MAPWWSGCKATAGILIVEVDRPDRRARRAHGKSDPLDAYSAARAALSGAASVVTKLRHGRVEAIRALRVARSSAVKARSQATNQIKSLIVTGPPQLREQLRDQPTSCGAAPIPASSGRTHRHRLNRGGDRSANNALYVAVLGRALHRPRNLHALPKLVAENTSAQPTCQTIGASTPSGVPQGKAERDSHGL
jgi:hypothetical protein